MKIPLYSQLKLKLESKGIDSITSGQIAWFMCSVGLCIVPIIFLYFDKDKDQYAILWGMFLIFALNLVYFKNIFPLLTVVGYYYLILTFSQLASAIIIVYPLIIAVITRLSKHLRFLTTFVIGVVFLEASLKLFYLLGGFYK